MLSSLKRFGRMGAPAGQSIESAIRAIAPDAWYDPSDLTTLFQDSAGTTPVTALEQPVGLMLDKSRGLVLGSELVTNGDFSSGTTGWTLGAGWSVVNGQLARDNLQTSSSNVSANQGTLFQANKSYRITLDIVSISGQLDVRSNLGGIASFSTTGTKTLIFNNTTAVNLQIQGVTTLSCTIDSISVRELPGAHAYHTPGDTTTRPTVSRRINEFIGTETLATQNVTTRATNYSLRFSGTGSITLSGTATGTYSAGTHTITCTAGTLTATVSGSVTQAMLTPSGLAVLPYQRVTTTSDYDSDASKFPTFLRTDGVNDSLQTNAIDFSGTDKMFVGAAVRKLSDASYPCVLEFSSSIETNNGTFALFSSNGVDAGRPAWNWAPRGTIKANVVSPENYTSPVTSVLSGIGDISGDSAILRINGAQAASSTVDQGTGNYGNHKLYLFMRAGTSLPFNGWFYGSLIKGSTLSASQIALAERWLASKTKTVTL